jgi:Xaa-Pro aminopeptidase
MKMTKTDWEEWQANPVTVAAREAVKASLSAQQAAATQAYWSGRAWSEIDRAALVRVLAWHEDFFTASFEEMKAAIEAGT